MLTDLDIVHTVDRKDIVGDKFFFFQSKKKKYKLHDNDTEEYKNSESQRGIGILAIPVPNLAFNQLDNCC